MRSAGRIRSCGSKRRGDAKGRIEAARASERGPLRIIHPQTAMPGAALGTYEVIQFARVNQRLIQPEGIGNGAAEVKGRRPFAADEMEGFAGRGRFDERGEADSDIAKPGRRDDLIVKEVERVAPAEAGEDFGQEIAGAGGGAVGKTQADDGPGGDFADFALPKPFRFAVPVDRGGGIFLAEWGIAVAGEDEVRGDADQVKATRGAGAGEVAGPQDVDPIAGALAVAVLGVGRGRIGEGREMEQDTGGGVAVEGRIDGVRSGDTDTFAPAKRGQGERGRRGVGRESGTDEAMEAGDDDFRWGGLGHRVDTRGAIPIRRSCRFEPARMHHSRLRGRDGQVFSRRRCYRSGNPGALRVDIIGQQRAKR
jgi:hypothetical protein